MAGGLQEPDLVKAANSEYRNQSDKLIEFLSERCDTTSIKRTRSSEVYRAYKAFIEGRGSRPLSEQRFSEAMRERGFVKKEKSGIGYWLNLELKPQDFFEGV